MAGRTSWRRHQYALRLRVVLGKGKGWKALSLDGKTPVFRLQVEGLCFQGLLTTKKPWALVASSASCPALPLGCLAAGEGRMAGGEGGKGVRVWPGVEAADLLLGRCPAGNRSRTPFEGKTPRFLLQ